MAKSNSKHKANKKSKIREIHYNKIVTAIAFVIVLIFLAKFALQNKNINKPYDKTQIILNNENITQNLEESIIVQNEKIYMSFNDIKKFLDSNIYLENDTNTIITTAAKKLATATIGEDSIFINNSPLSVKSPVIQENDKIYLQISALENVYNYELKYIKNSNIVTIDSLNKKKVKAYAKKNFNVKDGKNVVDKVKKGNWVIYINGNDGMAKVRTQNGYMGEVKLNLLDNFVTEREDFEENGKAFNKDEAEKFDITSKDISTYKKRKEVIDFILQETIKNDKIFVEITYSKDKNFEYERFKIEALPILRECGITVEM